MPLYFVVRVRVRERGEGGAMGKVISEGEYERLFSLVVGEERERRQEEEEEEEWGDLGGGESMDVW